MIQLNYHSRDVVPYLLAIWALIVINTSLRSITTRYTQAVLTPLRSAKTTSIFLPDLVSGWGPGQHVRIRLFCLGWSDCLESHPFTIATATGEGVELIAKVAGDWTQKLYEYAGPKGEVVEGSPNTVRIRCLVEGPYGEWAILVLQGDTESC